MRKCIQSGVFGILACAMTMSLSAQQYPPSSAQTPTGSKADSNKVTVTGCLAKASATPSPTGTAGAAGATASTDTTKFVLNDVTASASPTAGTAGASSAAIASSYRLDGDDSKLTPHVGHKIEITGTVDKAMGDKADKPEAAASAPSAPKLKVDNVKMIASSCTP